MFYNYLKLNFILELQKKYNSNFSMFTDKIFVLPPIFKKININYYLCFPVTKMLDEFSLTHPLKISRPIGVVLVSKNGKETIYNMSEYDFTSLSRDFNIPYLYNIERQEEIKSCLDMLSFSFPKLSREQKKAKLNIYFEKLQSLLSKEYINFYFDLKNNSFIKISNIKQQNQNLNNNIQLSDYKSKIKINISAFVKKDILANAQMNISYYKLLFFDNLGKHLREFNFSFNYENDLSKLKFDILKIFSKIVNKIQNIELQVDFISKILIMIMNSLLVEQKKRRKIEKFEKDLYNYYSIFNDEIINIDKMNNEKKEYLTQIFKDLQKDYNLKKGEKYSNIFFGYLYVFN